MVKSSGRFECTWGCAVISAGTQVLVVGLQTAFAMRFHPGRIWWKVGQTAFLHSLAALQYVGRFYVGQTPPDGQW